MNKRSFNGIEQPVAHIGLPETSIDKWMPEGAELKEIEEKHLTIRLPDMMLQNDPPEQTTHCPLLENSGVSFSFVNL